MELGMCRICLVRNIRMYSIVNTDLQYIYEKLTECLFITDGSRPLLVCYICYARLKNSHELMLKCFQSEQILMQMLNSNQPDHHVEDELTIQTVLNLSVCTDCNTITVIKDEPKDYYDDDLVTAILPCKEPTPEPEEFQDQSQSCPEYNEPVTLSKRLELTSTKRRRGRPTKMKDGTEQTGTEPLADTFQDLSPPYSEKNASLIMSKSLQLTEPKRKRGRPKKMKDGTEKSITLEPELLAERFHNETETPPEYNEPHIVSKGLELTSNKSKRGRPKKTKYGPEWEMNFSSEPEYLSETLHDQAAGQSDPEYAVPFIMSKSLGVTTIKLKKYIKERNPIEIEKPINIEPEFVEEILPDRSQPYPTVPKIKLKNLKLMLKEPEEDQPKKVKNGIDINTNVHGRNEVTTSNQNFNVHSGLLPVRNDPMSTQDVYLTLAQQIYNQAEGGEIYNGQMKNNNLFLQAQQALSIMKMKKRIKKESILPKLLKKNRNHAGRQKFTLEQKTKTKEFFKTHIENKKLPSRSEIKALIARDPILFHNKNEIKIYCYLHNLYSNKCKN